MFTDYVAFAAYATSHQSPADGVDLQFAGVLTNAGDGYDSATSRFTCPLTGYYYFYFNLYVAMDEPNYDFCWVEMLMDETVMAEVGETVAFGWCAFIKLNSYDCFWR